MMADVCDEDELQTGQRREGAYSSIYWWIVKLGMSASFAASGLLLNLTGFDEDLDAPQAASTIMNMRIVDVAVPAFVILLSIYFMKRFTLTEDRMYAIRAELEANRESAESDS